MSFSYLRDAIVDDANLQPASRFSKQGKTGRSTAWNEDAWIDRRYSRTLAVTTAPVSVTFVEMAELMTSQPNVHAFPPTRWSVVLMARDDAPQSAAALETICRAYWYPLYAYVRRCGHSAHDAQDLTQEFFARLLEKRWLEAADREKGKLRTFLIVALKNFMAKEWRRASAQKRGGHRTHVPLDTAIAEGRYAADASSTMPAEDIFEQQWALTLIDLTIQRLRREFAAAGKPDDFDAMKHCLVAERGSIDYDSVATALGTSEGAARVAVHRLRKRFREIYRDEISQTLSERADLASELQHLAAALVSR